MTATKKLTAVERTGMLFKPGPQIIETSNAKVNARFPERYVLVDNGELGRGHLVTVERWKEWNALPMEKQKFQDLETFCGVKLCMPQQVAMGRRVCQTCASHGTKGRIVRVRKGVR